MDHESIMTTSCIVLCFKEYDRSMSLPNAKTSKDVSSVESIDSLEEFSCHDKEKLLE
jgi:hypothetical protein